MLYQSGWVPSNYGIRLDIFCDNGPSSYNGAVSDGDPAENQDAVAYPDVVADGDVALCLDGGTELMEPDYQVVKWVSCAKPVVVFAS